MAVFFLLFGLLCIFLAAMTCSHTAPQLAKMSTTFAFWSALNILTIRENIYKFIRFYAMGAPRYARGTRRR